MNPYLRVPALLATTLAEAGLSGEHPNNGTVFAAAEYVGDDWDSILEELTVAFTMTRQAMHEQRPVVYVVAVNDLLGRRGVGGAIVACGLLSAARTAAIEAAKTGTAVNTLAVDETSDVSIVASWVQRLLEPGGPSGEIVRLGTEHIGKALP